MAQATKVGKEAALAAKRGEAPASAPWGSAADAARYEQEIAERAARIRGDDFDGAMTAGLFLKLWPLLREPLHEGHIVHTTAGKGKPYASDGAKSVQVLIDRCNNVLTPLCWEPDDEYESAGKICKVTVRVFDAAGRTLVKRSSWGGVDRGSEGNIRKGSFTNAAKLAFARLGPGHEIYLGAHDFDPDTNAEIAAQQARKSTQRESASTDNGTASEGAVQQVDPAQELAVLLDMTHPLQAKRKQAADGMGILGAPVAQQLREIQACPDDRSLDGLIGRIQAALDEQAS